MLEEIHRSGLSALTHSFFGPKPSDNFGSVIQESNSDDRILEVALILSKFLWIIVLNLDEIGRYLWARDKFRTTTTKSFIIAYQHAFSTETQDRERFLSQVTGDPYVRWGSSARDDPDRHALLGEILDGGLA